MKYIVIAILVFFLIISLSIYTKENFYWTEEKRNNKMFEKYPPCYDICGATRLIQDKLESIDKKEKYHKLLDVYSIVLCQEKFKTSSNAKEMMNQRIKDLENMGAKRKTEFDVERIMNQYPSSDPLVKDFLLLATNLIQREIDSLSKDDIETSLKDSIINLNNVFYQVHYPIVSKIQF
jgi:hypothetical protein